MIRIKSFTTGVALLLLTICRGGVHAQSAEELVEAATASLPEHLRDGAAVIHRGEGGIRRTLREGSNGLICQTDSPSPFYMASCQHESWLPLMSRMGELMSEGRSMGQALGRINQELSGGQLASPEVGSIFSVASGPSVEELDFLLGIFMGEATGESTGLPTEPTDTGVWLMCSGTPQAHIMIGLPPYIHRRNGLSVAQLCGLEE